MPRVMHLYIDDSGTRNLDRVSGNAPAHGYDWFAMGGVLVRQEDEARAREQHARLMHDWRLDSETTYLHSAEIRGRCGQFSWLAALPPDEHSRFLEDLTRLLVEPPFLGFACVIDRPGYERRYRERYGRSHWSLCKTAFAVVVERAAKYAFQHGYKLKVFVERADRRVDGWIRGYYDHLREHGMPFDPGNMAQYQPMTAADLRATLYDFRTKAKSSPIMQVADLYLWPMAMGGYHRSNRPYSTLIANERLIDCLLSEAERPMLGIKYSCWDLVEVRA